MAGRSRVRFEEALSRMCDDLRELVSRESPSDDPARVASLAWFIRDALRSRRVEAQTYACPAQGDALLASVGGKGGTLILGHLDTVWPVGSLAEIPFRIDAGRATGPGVFDMKAGIAVALAVLPALAEEPEPAPVSLLLVPDEEVGTHASRGLLLETAGRHRRVLALEPSLDGAVKLERKGTGLFRLASAAAPSTRAWSPRRVHRLSPSWRGASCSSRHSPTRNKRRARDGQLVGRRSRLVEG